MKDKEEIEWGKKMIKISVNFWTNGLPPKADKKTAWGSGAIHLIANKQRGLNHSVVFFNDMDEFFTKLGELLKRNNVKLLPPPESLTEIDFSKLSKNS